VPAAQEEWKRAHAEVHNGGGYPAEERLYHLTMALHGAHREAQQHEQARALLESALDVLKEPRHRQMFHSMLARAAARSGDIAGAEAWLATCTPHSDDLQTDTAWRFGRAFISTSARDFAKVLAVLGSRHGDIRSSLATTGVRVNNRPQLELTFQVQAPGRDPFVIKHREVMPEIRIPQVQPGNVLPVLFSPDDPTLFVIDWPE
jgi:hypothetical protein